MASLDQSYTAGQDNDDLGVGKFRISSTNNQILGQSFTPTLDLVTRIELYLKKINTPSGNLWLEIHADGADPSAAAQQGADSSLVAASSVGTSYGYIAFDFPTPVSLTPGTKYWILLYGDYSYSGSDNVFWGVDTSSPSYSGGEYGRYGNGSAAWETIASYDALFKQYGDTAAMGAFLQHFV